MGFMSKIKNILFEEEEDNDIPTIFFLKKIFS